ncbi:hypothetical protein PoB_007107800 [Plakobranchus ocellatus]|uniref:Uncharacterized protein n=1 Tax=Plakobranchus ocellatus TaxID=259542 RepID=A0AAV4DKG6_9GAST|nr:hypothetical protein PoB_007107800 [Plakobranchus ocellatus]
MFEECQAIKGTSDESAAAEALVNYARNVFNCQLTTSELTGNGGMGATPRSFGLYFGMVLTVIMMKFFLI